MESIKKLIDEKLWNEIKRNYLNEQYSNAVLDGIQYIGDLIRDMSGEDGDGYNLMGKVFNTKNPKIKINKLRTQTEKDVQNGVMLLIQGFYRAIRNERVHEKKQDSQQEAFELILFINHILRIVDKSTGRFTIENTLERVFDDNFLPKKEYAEHIVNNIPTTKKYEVAIEIFRKREQSKKISDLSIFWNVLKEDLKPKELEDFRNEVSETLRYADTPDEVTSVVFLVGSDWERIEADSRLRAENLLIRKMPTYLSDDPREGPDASVYRKLTQALYQLYAEDLMELKSEFAEKVFSLFEKTSPVMTEYVINSFGGILKELNQYVPFKELDDIIIKRFKSGDRELVNFVERFYSAEKASKLKENLPPKSPFDIDDDLPF